MRIGELSKITEISIDTIRYYEKMGLLNPIDRTESGYRIYDHDGKRRLQFIRRAQSLGFTLDEIKELLGLHEKPDADCAPAR